MSAYVIRRICLAMLAVVFLSGSDCGGSNHNSGPAQVIQKPQVEWNVTSAATCNGGASAPAANMNKSAQILANLIATYQGDIVTGPPNTTNVGVAQWHANDMATHGAVSLVGSDGEDALMRITCSGGTASTTTGVIAVGVDTDPQAIMNALLNDINANAMIQAFTTTNGATGSIAVGYSDGYWMIILQ